MHHSHFQNASTRLSVSAVVGASGDLLYNSSPLPASLFMLSIGPTINASILLSVLLELPGRTFEQWREHLRHGIKVRTAPALLPVLAHMVHSWQATYPRI